MRNGVRVTIISFLLVEFPQNSLERVAAVLMAARELNFHGDGATVRHARLKPVAGPLPAGSRQRSAWIHRKGSLSAPIREQLLPWKCPGKSCRFRPAGGERI